MKKIGFGQPRHPMVIFAPRAPLAIVELVESIGWVAQVGWVAPFVSTASLASIASFAFGRKDGF